MNRPDAADRGPRENPYAAPQAPLEPEGRRLFPVRFFTGMFCLAFCTILATIGLTYRIDLPDFTVRATTRMGFILFAVLCAFLAGREFRLAWRKARSATRQ